MTFLTAQSHDFYYLWQLEVQLHNFKDLHVPSDKIHILFSHDPIQELDFRVKQFMADYSEYASFFIYEDTRESKIYGSSIRPHIIKKHILQFPDLNKEPIFYHDADIIFKEFPDLERFAANETWYVSDTRNYLDAGYLKQYGETIIDGMCEIIGIDKSVVLENDMNVGGAQYVIKNSDYDFWDAVERDSERLFTFLCSWPPKSTDATGKKDCVQAWCTDMWTVLWTAWKRGFDVKIDKDLDFCWPSENMERWEKTKILHNTGVEMPDKIFDKCQFVFTHPFFRDLSYVDNTKCTIKYVEYVNRVTENYYKDLSDVTFLISVRIDSPEKLENLHCVLRYLTKFFKTNILLLETGSAQTINETTLPPSVNYTFYYTNDNLYHITKYRNMLLKKVTTDIVFFYDTDVVFAPYQIYDAASKLRHQDAAMCYPYDEEFINVINNDRSDFLTTMDISKLIQNKNLPGKVLRGSYSGCVGLRKSDYEKCGYENELIYGCNHDDQERNMRTKIMGMKVERIKGPLFHLNHPVSVLHGYVSKENELSNLSEYLRVCNLTSELLRGYVNSPSWNTPVLTP